MKKIFFILCIFSLAITACEYDNYEAPMSKLHGHLDFDGQTLILSSHDSYIELWEVGDWPKKEAIRVYFNTEGEFSQMLFDSEYKMVIPASLRPFVITDSRFVNDTMRVVVKGDTELKIDVRPYYTVEDATYEFDKATNKMKAHCRVRCVEAPDKSQMDIVRCYVGKSAGFIHGYHMTYQTFNANNIPSGSIDDVQFNTSALAMNTVHQQDNLYCRIFVKVKGINNFVSTKTQAVPFK